MIYYFLDACVDGKTIVWKVGEKYRDNFIKLCGDAIDITEVKDYPMEYKNMVYPHIECHMWHKIDRCVASLHNELFEIGSEELQG